MVLLMVAFITSVPLGRGASSATTLFFDDFERTDLGSQWEIYDYPNAVEAPSRWGIRDGALFQDANIYQHADYLGTLAVAGSASWTNYTVIVRLRPTDNDGWGIFARYQNPSNYYRFFTVQDASNGGPFTRLEKCVNGTTTPLMEITNRSFNANVYLQVRVDAYGDQLAVWVNQEKLLTANDTSLTAGKAGIGTWACSVEVEDLRVLDAPPPFTPLALEQWDFDSGDLRATRGTDLEFASDAVRRQTRFGSTRDFGLPDIGGQPARVMEVPALDPMPGYMMRSANFPNGGGAHINQFTFIFDVFYPTNTAGQWQALLQTDPSNQSDGDLFVSRTGGFGIPDRYDGNVTLGAWHRLALAVDLTVPVAAKFIDGVKVGEQNPGAWDGRLAINSLADKMDYALLFADNNGENALGYVNSVQFRPERLSDAVLAALGGPSASGIPLPTNSPPAYTNLTIIAHPASQTLIAGSNVTFSVQADGPSPLHYQWFKDAVTLPGATNASLTLTQVKLADAGSYSVTISIAGASTNSQPARLTVVTAGSGDGWVVLGRYSLANTNLSTARDQFLKALAVEPSNPGANTLLVLASLAILPQAPETKAFLDRMNVSPLGRDPFNWTAGPALDTNGFPILPDGFRSTELSAFAQDHLLPVIAESAANLARVTDTNIVMDLTADELKLLVSFKTFLTGLLAMDSSLSQTLNPMLDRMTTAGQVELDFADLSFFRSILAGVEMAISLSKTINLDIDLSRGSSYFGPDRSPNVDQLLRDYPRLLTVESTNDLPAAREAFGRFATLYPLAMSQMDQRPTNRLSLFNPGEESLLSVLLTALLPTLKTSLDGPTPLLSTNTTVNLGLFFSGKVSPRLLLPRFLGTKMVLGTIPDLTFGGMIQGLPLDLIEDLLSLKIPMVPNILRARVLENRGLELTIRAAKEHGYAVQGSPDLKQWTNGPIFLAATNQLAYVLPPGGKGSRYFFRLRDFGTNLPAPANDNFADRTALIGSPVSTVGYNFNATREPGEPVMNAFETGAGKTVWYSWTADKSGPVIITATAIRGLRPLVGVFTGTALNELARVAEGWEEVSFDATAAATYQVGIDGEPSAPVGGFQLSIVPNLRSP